MSKARTSKAGFWAGARADGATAIACRTGSLPGEQRWFRTPLRVLAGFLFLAVAAFAAEPPPLDEKPSVLIWQVLNFLMLAGLLGWMAVKQGGPLLAARSKEIAEGLAAGEKAKAEADARAAEVQGRLANLESEVAAMRAGAREEREREADRIRREAQAEIARIHHQAEHEIEAAGKQARLEVQRVAAHVAIELAEHQVRARMSPEIQAALLEGFLSDLSGNGAVHAASNVD